MDKRRGIKMLEKVIRIIEEVTDKKIDSADMLLFEKGILDSFKIIELISELEDFFEIDIDAKYVIEENFCTVSAIERLISEIIEA